RRLGLETLLAGLAIAAVGSFGACGGATEDPGRSSGASAADGSTGSDGMRSCENGKDPLCSCNLPGPWSGDYEVLGPPDGGVDAGEGGNDGCLWSWEDECTTHHPNRNGTFQACLFIESSPRTVTCMYYVKCVGRRPAELEEPCLESTEARELLSVSARLEE